MNLKQVVPLAKSLIWDGDITEYIDEWKVSSRKMKKLVNFLKDSSILLNVWN